MQMDGLDKRNLGNHIPTNYCPVSFKHFIEYTLYWDCILEIVCLYKIFFRKNEFGIREVII